MHITWHGQYTIKIVSKDTTLIIDPYAPSTGLTPFRAKADIVAVTNPADESMSQISGIQGDPTVINTPGEYSIKGLTLTATPWMTEENVERSIQVWSIEGITVLHIGALNRELTDEELQVIEQSNIDIFFAPVGGGDSLTMKQVLSLISTIEPRIIIPIHYKLPKLKEELDGVEQFAREMGISAGKKEKKLTVRANGLPQDDVETVILSA